jgi:excisionase family DNA binding protein
MEDKLISSEVLVYDVPEAGRLLGLKRNRAYAAAAAGEIPTIRFGRLLKVPKAAIDRLLEAASHTPGDH